MRKRKKRERGRSRFFRVRKRKMRIERSNIFRKFVDLIRIVSIALRSADFALP